MSPREIFDLPPGARVGWQDDPAAAGTVLDKSPLIVVIAWDDTGHAAYDRADWPLLTRLP